MTYVYRMAFPIEDDRLRVSQVINQALLLFPEQADRAGIRLLGDVSAWIDGDKVYCEAAAEVVEGRRPRAMDLHGWRVAALHAAGRVDREVSEELGIGIDTARKLRLELGLPAIGKTRSAA